MSDGHSGLCARPYGRSLHGLGYCDGKGLGLVGAALCRSGDRDRCRSRADRSHGENGLVDRYDSHTFVARRRGVGEVLPAELITKRDRFGRYLSQEPECSGISTGSGSGVGVGGRWLGHGDGKGLFGLALESSWR